MGLFHSYRPYRKAANFLSFLVFLVYKLVVQLEMKEKLPFDVRYNNELNLRCITCDHVTRFHTRSFFFSISAGGRWEKQKSLVGGRESSGRNSVQSPRSAIRKSHLNDVVKRRKIIIKEKKLLVLVTRFFFFSFLNRINTLTYTLTHTHTEATRWK